MFVAGAEYPALLRQAQRLVTGKNYAEAATVLRRVLQIKSEPRVERAIPVE